MRRLGSWAVGIATGAVIAYLLDPDRGRSRRARIADQGRARARRAAETARASVEYQRGVARGVLHDITEPFRPARHYDDETLLQKVRSEALGYWEEGDVVIDIRDGMVRLTGTADDETGRDRLISLIRAVDGVGMIDDRLEVAGGP